MRFYLGTHQPGWLSFAGVPLFVSAVRLRKRKGLPKAAAPWALDSGGFSEIAAHGRWTVSARQYAEEAVRWAGGIGRMDWAAPMDWMCEPQMIEKTGLSVREHQDRTTASLLELRSLAPSVPWVPVLQGWRYDDYMRHADAYAGAGIDLAAEPVVGIGSVCRRQGTAMAEELVRDLHRGGLRLHAFGFKVLGLERCAGWLASADSMAWSAQARKQPVRLEGCPHRTCANCWRWASQWRNRVLEAAERGERACERESSQGLLWAS